MDIHPLQHRTYMLDIIPHQIHSFRYTLTGHSISFILCGRVTAMYSVFQDIASCSFPFLWPCCNAVVLDRQFSTSKCAKDGKTFFIRHPADAQLSFQFLFSSFCSPACIWDAPLSPPGPVSAASKIRRLLSAA